MIKFRRWDKENSTMLTWEQLKSEADFSWFADENLVFMQSTGLKDKNGVEIYEGDILKNGRGEIGQVIYLQQEAGFVVSLKKRDYRLGHRNTGEGYKIANDHTVIGNIYENPRLLEVTK